MDGLRCEAEPEPWEVEEDAVSLASYATTLSYNDNSLDDFCDQPDLNCPEPDLNPPPSGHRHPLDWQQSLPPPRPKDRTHEVLCALEEPFVQLPFCEYCHEPVFPQSLILFRRLHEMSPVHRAKFPETHRNHHRVKDRLHCTRCAVGGYYCGTHCQAADWPRHRAYICHRVRARACFAALPPSHLTAPILMCSRACCSQLDSSEATALRKQARKQARQHAKLHGHACLRACSRPRARPRHHLRAPAPATLAARPRAHARARTRPYTDRPRAQALRLDCRSATSSGRVLMQRAPRGQRRAQAQHTLALLNMGVDGGATGVVARARSRARDRALARADVMACLRRVSADSREPRAEGHTRGQPTADSRPAARAAGGAHAPRASAGIVARARALARSRAQVHVCAGVGARPAHLAQPGAGGCARPPCSLCTLVHPAACASCHFIKILIILENRFGGEGGRGRWQNGRHTSRPSISTTRTCPPTRAHQPSTPPSPKQNQSGRLAQLNR
jgi:hypothetical protein